ncbi:hypothetical protein [Mesoplasma lactucae]|uniref:Uncharacterized protein n=1 Tax=Mesoplasma lactucae ATCC 49193 TaxID=81460 RepID=A0A291IRG2_9MOLU|nr:hypothetical protein [Mesoplasma lactucae]ATG97281.1 hypothetical protein CP520_00715 [Mesoplasma lactucae ATCC 49193]ATZ20269.1 hypothetical protein MLACT_v1c04480 [Mesoplasma lactucae ATCC 49193]MCL8216440.1 hypothetical protein [Mesoplasma lactucae ATCC 49193]
MNLQTTLNLVLLLILFLAMVVFLIIKMVYTKNFQQLVTPRINSRNIVVSNHDLDMMIEYYKNRFELDDYEITRPDKFLNFGRNLNKHKKQIAISKRYFDSVGYEIDYFISRLWFSSRQLKKDNQVKVYSLVANFLIGFTIWCYVAIIVLQIILFIIIVAKGGSDIQNPFLKFIWKVPVFDIIAFCLIALLLAFFLFLNEMKIVIQDKYTKDVLMDFKENFLNYYDDLKAAMTYDSEIHLSYNFAFKNRNDIEGIKWLGPFVKY